MAEATGETFGGMLDAIDSSFEKLGPAEGLKRFVNRYLSDGHVKGPGSGCVVAALGSESARAGPAVCKTFAVTRQSRPIGLPGGLSERRNVSDQRLALWL